MKEKHELQEMDYYYNCSRKDQIVQIKYIASGRVCYEVIRQNAVNKITEFLCTIERFKRLYIKK